MTSRPLSHIEILNTLVDRFQHLAEGFLQAGDTSSARGLEALQQKLVQQHLSIAFCGHVSGGKSALINALIGHDVLPTSPVPSSANIVSIQSGPPAARALLKTGEAVDLDLASSLPDVQSHCVDGTNTDGVVITVPHDLFEGSVSLIDTPGVDSADKARRLAEDPAIISADVVFYVMDYNHVQSEINFAFTKRLRERGKPVYLIVNQIDKHCDFELDFGYFKRSSEAGFATWDIQPNGLYFTTLTEPDHPENQLDQLKAHLRSIFLHEQEILIATVLPAARQLIEDHSRRQSDQQADRRQELQSIVEETENLEQALRTYQDLSRQVENLRRIPEQLQTELDSEIRRVVENARITPFTTTERAQRYLESRAPGFKVGFLFSGDKTKKEISVRLDALYEDFRHHVSTQLEWHLRDVLGKVPEAHGAADSDYLQKVNSFSLTWGPELMVNAVREGAVASNEYIHNYTRDIANEVKAMYRREALYYAEEAVRLAKQGLAERLEQLTRQLEPLSVLMDAIKNLEKMDQFDRQYREKLLTMLQKDLPKPEPIEKLLAPLMETVGKAEAGLEATNDSSAGSLTSLGQAIKENAAPLRTGLVDDHNTPAAQTAKRHPSSSLLHQTGLRLHAYASAVSSLPGFQHIAEALTLRAERLEKNIFTVALFGAFSAGKSSVANALLGHPVLPVSPNPTTAAINKILPPNDHYPHGTVRVQLKTADDIESDVMNSLKACDVQAASMAEALERLQDISPGDIHPTAKPHYSFLNAVARGIAAVENRFGQELIIDLDTFHDYVASEEKACFVEWIELYYRCPLTDHGIMLVDTPGADSINARHTGVAFDYIKNADAVLFVTYFNSAFSHADQDFLFQLGRVKDSFAMDKMFFLINAADLAKTSDELETVKQHVKERVAACGIRQPRLYTVSSQTALLARLGQCDAMTSSLEKTYRQRTIALSAARGEATPGDGLLPWDKGLDLSGFAQFEEEFFHFTLDELTAVALSAAESEMQRTLSSLEEVIAAAKTDATSRRIKRAAFEASRMELEQSLNRVGTAAEADLLHKEIDELVYYVKQRLFYRFGDMFDRYFNPAVLQDARGNITKKGFQHCLDDLLQTMEKELEQELRATSLRVENFVHKRAGQYLEKLNRVVTATASHCALPDYEPAHLPTPEMPKGLFRANTSSVGALLNSVKTSKEFFEGTGRAKFRQDLETLLQVPVDVYLSKAIDVVKDAYSESLRAVLETVHAATLQTVADYYAGLLAALTTDFDLKIVENTYEQLKMVELK
ncbi:dynamin family protein [Heliobacterium chlorum]|uniref:Dynamin family protein n=1 Tax=Heliobacterium chlorum TaxID=2698 RepID=A0ABR7T164_HELCL|nr:dynamin family protein [Heliobacterium chlorum]MBC9784426.1 dynamin family protein [Heliobacterium chlorum]